MDAHQMIAGRYTLQREIGRGGSGVVMLATDEVLGRPVAIKRLGVIPGAEQPDLARAEREARLAAALNHPHVVAIFDLVEEGEAHWLVMEYVAGTTLAELARESGGLAYRHAAGLLAQAADALADAHSAGIVHRDVKPSNILITAEGQAKLTDFGIARANADASLTQTGLVTGSPAYLAPEVASGASATQASDVWSLGATMFHALTGRPPYDIGDNLIGGLYRIVHDDPPQHLGAGPLATLLAATMVKDPAGRWSMAQVRDELRSVAGGGRGSTAPAGRASPPAPPVTAGSGPAQPETLAQAAPPPHRRGAAWRWLATAAVLVVLVFGAITLWPGDGSRPSAQESPSDTPTPSDTPSQSDTPEPGAGAKETKQQMRQFISGYLSSVTSDPEAAFRLLTPTFQDASGGYEGYMGWWGKVRSAKPRNIDADPEALTVAYTVDYVMKNGNRDTQRIQLQLERQGDALLIDGEG